MLEFIAQFVGELLLQVAIELLAELGLHWLRNPSADPPNPFLSTIGYALFGAAVGGLSLLIFGDYLVSAPWRVANLLVTPVLAGLLMAALGMARVRRGQAIFRIDRFAYGYVFALALAVVRYRFAG